ncbi:DMT family transporter [Legionella tunisiensis]|uniref:DMT family transporter n=1 Tax=Legionella tunisiensis TaxID=1034944 RepID=UPI0038BA6891
MLGVAGIGIYNICLNYGELSVSAGVASFVIGLIPVVTIVLSVLFLQERPTPAVWGGILISFIGLLFLIIGEESNSASMTSGVLVILIATFMGAFYTVAQKRYLRNYHPVAVTAWIIWGGTLMLLIFLPSYGKKSKWLINRQLLLPSIWGFFLRLLPMWDGVMF